MKKLLATVFVACLSAPAAALPAFATFSDFEAHLDVSRSVTAGGTQVSLLSGGLFGRGGIGHGVVDFGEGAGPADILWLVQDAHGVRPSDRTAILRFSFNSAGDFMGIEPTPFRIFLTEYPPDPVYPPDPIAPVAVIGELDFSGVVSAALGSITDITGLRLVGRGAGAPDLEFAPFSIQSVPEPSPLLLTLFALLAVASVARRCTPVAVMLPARRTRAVGMRR